MLVAHLVPGYFAAACVRQHSASGRCRRALAWAVALGAAVAPDLDVLYNVLFRGFFNHTTLWTHSIFVYAALALAWWALRRSKRWPDATTLLGLAVAGGLSHLLLDVASHGTPLLYPLTLHMFGAPPARVLEGGLWAYVTDPIFLAEPFLLAMAAAHWVLGRRLAPAAKRLALCGLAVALGLFVVSFVGLMPVTQALAARMG